MNLLSLFKKVSLILDYTEIASRVIPHLWKISLDISLSISQVNSLLFQYQQIASCIDGLSYNVRETHMQKLKALASEVSLRPIAKQTITDSESGPKMLLPIQSSNSNINYANRRSIHAAPTSVYFPAVNPLNFSVNNNTSMYMSVKPTNSLNNAPHKLSKSELEAFGSI